MPAICRHRWRLGRERRRRSGHDRLPRLTFDLSGGEGFYPIRVPSVLWGGSLHARDPLYRRSLEIVVGDVHVAPGSIKVPVRLILLAHEGVRPVIFARHHRSPAHSHDTINT